MALGSTQPLTEMSTRYISWVGGRLRRPVRRAEDLTTFMCRLFNPLNAKLNHICHLLALLVDHLILHISRIRVKYSGSLNLLER